MASVQKSGTRRAAWLPSGRALPARVWDARHRGIVLLLWAHVPFLFAFGVLTHHPAWHVLVDLQPVILAATAASLAALPRGLRAGVATFGLVACSAILVHFSGGVIEMHFHFFVVVGLITLYQDWIPFSVAIGFTVLEHGVVGVLAPTSVYNHHAAQSNPWLWALIHGAFVLAASVPHILAWRQNEDQAWRDPLTRLSNRTLLSDRLGRALAQAERRDTPLAVLFIDLDHFKQVNDTLGHPAGDELLVACSARLSACVRDDDVVGRLGGDEFAVILVGPSADAAEEIAQRLIDVIAQPTVVSGHEIVMTASIGIAYASAQRTAEELLRNADLAMYVAKSSGRAHYEVFDDAMHERAIDRLELEADLRQAVAADEITVQCQPIVELSTGCVTGGEVLARWTHPERGAVPPMVFIPIAERTGLICAIGTRVFALACEVAQRIGVIDPSLTVTVNLSPVQLNDEDLPTIFAGILAEYGVDPRRIVLEVTETVLMQDLAVAAHRLAELKKIGVRIAVDDFGVGHSSLSYLRNLPVDVLKIDKSFVDDLPSGGDLARMMIQLGRMLGLDVVAEGVESAAQREALQLLGCPRAQGYLYARPMDCDALVDELVAGRLAVHPNQVGARVPTTSP
ncbi:MAG: diguanylate cyclase/phosphodiesterase with and sensor(s) [Actinomycetia bacterium]|nr:diguanylate cyclase/phosphodiesterase with and sensor(s) [Actinomycetes bacterium]